MDDTQYHTVNFIADNGAQWQDEYATFVPRAGDIVYPYELADGVYRVDEVWIVGEKRGRADRGTNVFVSRIPMRGSRLYNYAPDYYDGE